MKARPILFSGPMVRALLDGRKTQTRRMVKSEKQNLLAHLDEPYAKAVRVVDGGIVCDWLGGKTSAPVQCPYGVQGDLLWVRETFFPRAGELKISQVMKPHYRADAVSDRPEWRRLWKPSIHMPRWANRLTLEITDVRVQRLQDISEDDAIAEGISSGLIEPDEYGPTRIGYMVGPDDGVSPLKPRASQAFRELWQSINSPESWNANPWVWALSFSVHKQNIDVFLQSRAA